MLKKAKVMRFLIKHPVGRRFALIGLGTLTLSPGDLIWMHGWVGVAFLLLFVCSKFTVVGMFLRTSGDERISYSYYLFVLLGISAGGLIYAFGSGEHFLWLIGLNLLFAIFYWQLRVYFRALTIQKAAWEGSFNKEVYWQFQRETNRRLLGFCIYFMVSGSFGLLELS